MRTRRKAGRRNPSTIPFLYEGNKMNNEKIQEEYQEAMGSTRMLGYCIWAILLVISGLILYFIL